MAVLPFQLTREAEAMGRPAPGLPGFARATASRACGLPSRLAFNSRSS
ncbi:MAG: hypothetical protein ACYC3R_00165 [Thiomonas delicata]